MDKQEVKELKQDLDRVQAACDILYNMRGTIDLCSTIVANLDVPFFKGLTLYKSRPIENLNAAESSLQEFYRRLLEARTDIEKQLSPYDAEAHDEPPF